MAKKKEIDIETAWRQAMAERICDTSKLCMLVAKAALERCDQIEDVKGGKGWADAQNAARGWITTALKADGQAETTKMAELERLILEKAESTAKLDSIN